MEVGFTTADVSSIPLTGRDIFFNIRTQGGDMWGTTPELLLFPFFLFSLLAVGMARNRSSAQRDFLSGYRGIGMIVSFAVVVLAFGTG